MSALQDKKLKVGSLFAGIGGFDYGLELAGGFEIAWQIEIDPFCQQVLAKHWPNATRYGDIRECGIGRKYELSHIDVLCGGFPCQPHSLAGERKASEDERDLWSEFYRLIRELKPCWVVAENVLGLLSSENGKFFGRVLRDLAQAGYDAEWRVLRASDVGAPHRRERVFIVAYPCGSRRWEDTRGAHGDESTHEGWSSSYHHQSSSDGQSTGPMAHTTSQGLPSTGQTRLTTPDSQTRAGVEPQPERCSDSLADTSSAGWQECDIATLTSDTGHVAWRNLAPGNQGQLESCLGRNAHGLSTGMDRHYWPAGPGEEQHEWEPQRVVTERQPNRTKRLKALGNAIVPQLVALIGKAIVEHEIDSEGVA